MNAVAAIARPFAAVGSLTRTISASMFYMRGRSWGVLLSRTRIDYRTEVGDPSTNSIVGAVIGWISRNFPEAPVRILRAGEPVPAAATGPGFMLRLLERPNTYYSGVLQWMALIVDFVAWGNGYLVKLRNRNTGRVEELWWVPQSMMEPKWPEDDPGVFISHYEYTVDGEVYRIRTTDVIHFRNGLDPRNTRKGLSRLASLFREIFTDDEASNFTASLLRNLGVPGVVIAPSNTGGPTAKQDPEVVKQKFMEKFGGDKRGEPLVLTAPTDVKVLSFNPQQMELRELRRIPEERVSAVTGVPAGVAGLGAGLDRNTFSNYGEANRAAYTQGVIPLHRLIAAELEVQLLPDFVGADLEAYDVIFDASVVAAMQDAADGVWKRHESAATKGLITRATFKKATGQKVEPGDDVYIIPNNFSVIEAGGNPPPGLGLLPPGARPPPAIPPGAVGGLIGAGTAAVDEDPLASYRPPKSSRAAASEVRCSTCDKLLAEQASIPYRFTCHHCKSVTWAS